MIEEDTKTKIWYIKCKATGSRFTKQGHFSKVNDLKIYTTLGHAKNSPAFRYHHYEVAIFEGFITLTDNEVVE